MSALKHILVMAKTDVYNHADSLVTLQKASQAKFNPLVTPRTSTVTRTNVSPFPPALSKLTQLSTRFSLIKTSNS
jgi:hypothetical protein